MVVIAVSNATTIILKEPFIHLFLNLDIFV